MNKRFLAIIAMTGFLAVEFIGGAGDASAQGLLGRTRARFGRPTVCCTTTTYAPTRVTLVSRMRIRLATQQANAVCCPTTTVACEQPLAIQTVACCEPVACCQPTPVSCCSECCPVQRVSFIQRLGLRRQCCPTDPCCASDEGAGCQGAGCGPASSEVIEGEVITEEVIESPSDSEPSVPAPPAETEDKEA